MAMLRSIRFWVGGCLSLVCLWLAVRNVPFVDFAHYLTGANYIWLLPAVVLQLLAVVVRAWRWVVLLREKRDRLADSFWAQGIGYLFTNVLPLRMGEPARVIVMSERCGLAVMQVAASAFVERLLDVATIVFVLILILPWMQVPDLVIRAGTSFGALVLLVIVILLFVVRFRDRSERLLKALCKRIPILPAEWIVVRWKELVQGLAPLTEWSVAMQAISWSMVAWAFSIGTFWCVLYSFDSSATAVEAAFMIVALSLALTVPSSPGFIGVFQLVGQQALVLPFGTKYDAGSALAITLTAHLAYYLITSALGVIGLWRFGESFANLGRIITKGRSAPKTNSGPSPSETVSQRGKQGKKSC